MAQRPAIVIEHPKITERVNICRAFSIVNVGHGLLAQEMIPK
jgi:hypothetical protein